MRHPENLGLAFVVVLCEEKNVLIGGVDCHSFTIVAMIRILYMDVHDVLGANHNLVLIPGLEHLRLSELVDSERPPRSGASPWPWEMIF